MLNFFKLSPITSAEMAIQALAENPGVLGHDWSLLGKSEAQDTQQPDLLLRSPKGELTACLVELILNSSTLARGLSALGRIRRALPITPLLLGNNNLSGSRLLLLGGQVESQLLDVVGNGVDIMLLGEVPGQPGPPLLVYEPPLVLATTNMNIIKATTPDHIPTPPDDDEIEAIISGRKMEVNDDCKSRK